MGVCETVTNKSLRGARLYIYLGETNNPCGDGSGDSVGSNLSLCPLTHHRAVINHVVVIVPIIKLLYVRGALFDVYTRA